MNAWAAVDGMTIGACSFQSESQIQEKYALIIQRKWKKIMTRRAIRKSVLLTLYAPNMVRDRRRNEVAAAWRAPANPNPNRC